MTSKTVLGVSSITDFSSQNWRKPKGYVFIDIPMVYNYANVMLINNKTGGMVGIPKPE